MLRGQRVWNGGMNRGRGKGDIGVVTGRGLAIGAEGDGGQETEERRRVVGRRWGRG